METPAHREGRSARPAGRKRPWSNLAIAGLPLLAVFLGGATEKWAEGMVVALVGLLLIAQPPRSSLGRACNVILLALFACALAAFLPARWFFEPAWRTALLNDFRVPLPATLSPQPWVTLQCLCSFAAGVAWLYFICTRDWEPREVRFSFRTFAFGAVALAALCILLYVAHAALPFWHNARGFGPFPNRNQTADLFAISAVVVLACGADDLRNANKRWIAWAVALAILIAAIVLNFSRAGILLLVFGAAFWLGIAALQKGSAARIAVGLAALLTLLTIFLLFGGETLERFHLRGDGAGVSADFRWLIFQDAIQLIRNSPWFGVGLGNFEPIFAVFRVASAGDTRAHHPESDWMWFCAELGVIALAFALVGAVLLLRHGFPRAQSRNYLFRVGGFVGVVVFALHGLFDVSAHRIGTAFAAALLLGLAIRRPVTFERSRVVPVAFRLLGVVLMVVGVTWTVAVRNQLALPGSVGAENCRTRAMVANRERNFREATAEASRGLRWTPLDWQLYFIRAVAYVNQRFADDALDDFRRARFLEPNAYEVPFEEGAVWLSYQPRLALTAWREALRRAGDQRAEVYGRMVAKAEQSNPPLLPALETLGRSHSELIVRFFDFQRGENFRAALQRLLEEDPDLKGLNQSDRAKLFALWSERGDVAALAEFAIAHPNDLPLAWRGVANARAAAADYHAAVEFAQRFGRPSALPQIPPASADLSRALAADPDNYALGFALYQQQKEQGRTDDALNTARHFTAQNSAPAYFHFLEMECWAAKGDWERAWAAWQAYEAAASKTR